MQTLSIDQSAPLPVKRPATVFELCDLVKQARSGSQAVYPLGGRTTLDVGLSPLKPGIALDMTALNRVIDYPARDMTITVQAGIAIATLQAELAKEGQWLPVDIALPATATLGGAIALNKCGPRRYGHGTLRDYVIGISFVTDDGDEVKAGGRVVKNVAGYDLMKLQIGAAGTLGVVTQVTLKVKPKPEASAAVVFGCAADSLGAVLDLLHASKSRPVAVELLNREAWQAGGVSPSNSDSDWTLAIGFEEKSATVRWQVATLVEELKAVNVRDIQELADPAALWPAITALQVRPESRFIWKASVLPSRVAEAALVGGTPGWLVHAHALTGVVWGHVPVGDLSDFQANVILGSVEKETGARHLTTRRCPPEWKKSLAVWGRPTSDRDLMRRVKSTLDPDNVFNPGRLFGDI